MKADHSVILCLRPKRNSPKLTLKCAFYICVWVHTQFTPLVPCTIWFWYGLVRKSLCLWNSLVLVLFPLSRKRNLSYNTELTLKNISSTRNLPPCRIPGVDLATKSKLCKHWSSSGSEGAQVGNLCLHWKWGTQVGHPCRSPKRTHLIKEPLGAALSSGSRD